MNENCLRGFRCPICASDGPFDIEVVCTVRFHDDGTDPPEGELYYDDTSHIACVCGHEGTVMEFQIRFQDKPLLSREDKEFLDSMCATGDQMVYLAKEPYKKLLELADEQKTAEETNLLKLRDLKRLVNKARGRFKGVRHER